MDHLSPAEQQKVLVDRMAIEQEKIKRALEERQEEMMNQLDYKTRQFAEREVLRQMKHHRSRKEDKNSFETAQDVKLRLKEIEKEVRERILAE